MALAQMNRVEKALLVRIWSVRLLIERTHTASKPHRSDMGFKVIASSFIVLDNLKEFGWTDDISGFLWVIVQILVLKTNS